MTTQLRPVEEVDTVYICCCKDRGGKEHCQHCGKRTVKAQVKTILTTDRDTAYTLLRTLIAGKEKKAPLWESDERGYNQALDDILTLLDHIYGKTDALTK